MRYSDAERRILERHVTNLDGDVYAIYNLPPEVVAVVLAYVSRSPASFRDNLLKLVLGGDLAMGDYQDLQPQPGADLTHAQEKAHDFHRRITLGYGHSSVAELSTLTIGCERISRLASAELELANPWLSFIEFSQRYQRPRKGGYVTPPELEAQDAPPECLRLYHRIQETTFAAYETLTEELVDYLRRTVPRKEKESDRSYRRRIERIAFEDARYALTLGVHTNLGVTGNARAFRDAIVRLWSNPYRETTRLAKAIRTEALKICPTLIRYADPNPYQQALWSRFSDRIAERFPTGEATPEAWEAPSSERLVELVDWTGREEPTPPVRRRIQDETEVYLRPYRPGPATSDQTRALRQMLTAAAAVYAPPGADGPAMLAARLAQLPSDALRELYEELVGGRGEHDHPADALHQVRYRFRLQISEANWHQLLRHSRRIHFAPQAPYPFAGLTVPPNIRKAGLADILIRAAREAEHAYQVLAEWSPRAAGYVVTNAHHRRILADVSLWEMFHLVNLRGKPDAQWDIRQTVLAMRDAVRAIHPHLLDPSEVPALSR